MQRKIIVFAFFLIAFGYLGYRHYRERGPVNNSVYHHQKNTDDDEKEEDAGLSSTGSNKSDDRPDMQGNWQAGKPVGEQEEEKREKRNTGTCLNCGKKFDKTEQGVEDKCSIDKDHNGKPLDAGLGTMLNKKDFCSQNCYDAFHEHHHAGHEYLGN